MTEISHDLYYLLSLTSEHIKLKTQEAVTQYSKVELIIYKTNHFFDSLRVVD